MKILKSYFNLNMGGNNMKTKKKFITAYIVFLLSLLLMFSITSYGQGYVINAQSVSEIQKAHQNHYIKRSWFNIHKTYVINTAEYKIVYIFHKGWGDIIKVYPRSKEIAARFVEFNNSCESYEQLSSGVWFVETDNNDVLLETKKKVNGDIYFVFSNYHDFSN